MPTDHQREIRELFDAALDLPGAERLAWLEAQRQASPAALDAVRRLLKAARQSDSFLARPALRRLEHKPREGRRIGAYKIVRELDAGGMGVVYLCERDDGIFQRQAALKVIRSDFNTPELIASSTPSARRWQSSTTGTSPASWTAARPRRACRTSSWTTSKASGSTPFATRARPP